MFDIYSKVKLRNLELRDLLCELHLDFDEILVELDESLPCLFIAYDRSSLTTSVRYFLNSHGMLTWPFKAITINRGQCCQ